MAIKFPLVHNAIFDLMEAEEDSVTDSEEEIEDEALVMDTVVVVHINNGMKDNL